MLRVAVVASALLATTAGAGNAALIARTATHAGLAVTPSGAARVAYADGRELFVAFPRADGTVTRVRVARLPAGTPRVAGVEVDPRGRTLVLVEDEAGRWLRLADRVGTRWRLRDVPGPLPAGAVLGHAGLELDRTGRPAVAYAFRLPDRKTFLRLVTGGSFRTIGITREGFPESSSVPSAAPVRMPDGTIRVLETYAARGGGAILWRHAGSDWRGLFLSSSVGGTTPVGPAFARASGDVFGAAWTLSGPTPGELQARLAPRPDRPQSDVLHRHALVEALTIGPQGPELAATEPVAGLAAGLVLAGRTSLELDGRVLGLEAAAGAHHVVLLNDDGLAWYARAELPPSGVSLAAAVAPDGAVTLSGRVAGASGGAVEVYRERPGSPRELAGTAMIAPDGSFSLADVPPARPLFYRAVYRDPLSGIPSAALLRRPV